jgi:hypothetical protein
MEQTEQYSDLPYGAPPELKVELISPKDISAEMPQFQTPDDDSDQVRQEAEQPVFDVVKRVSDSGDDAYRREQRQGDQSTDFSSGVTAQRQSDAEGSAGGAVQAENPGVNDGGTGTEPYHLAEASEALEEQAGQGQGTKSQPRRETSSDPKDHKITVTHLEGLRGNRAGHVVVSLDGGAAVGFDTKSGIWDGPALAGVTVPGAVKAPDLSQRKVKGQVTIKVTVKELKAISDYVEQRTKDPGVYNEGGRNCTQFIIDAFAAGGLELPSSILPSGLIEDLKKYQKKHPDTQ